MSSYASPNITMEDWTSGLKNDIDIVEDQFRGWVFNQAKILTTNEHSGPAILALISSYFETITCYVKGQSSKKNESEFINEGLKYVFPELSEDVIRLYISEIRNGFSHETIFRKVTIHNGTQNLPQLGILPNGTLSVNPWYILEEIEANFTKYILTIRAEIDLTLLAAFKAFMDVRKQR
jgi:hypothetical protein